LFIRGQSSNWDVCGAVSHRWKSERGEKRKRKEFAEGQGGMVALSALDVIDARIFRKYRSAQCQGFV